MRFTSTFSVSVILALANAAALSTRAALAGQATYYGGNVAGGTCSFSTYILPSGIFGTALSDSNWDDATSCGACISVTGPSGNSITAMIVDECPGCGTNHLDLFPDAFSALADPTLGVIGVSWSYIDCPITSPLEVHNKEGVSANWFSMQVVNANRRVSTLEVSTDGGNTWQGTTRQTYNFFENSSGFGTTTVDVRVTSVSGDSVIVNNVEVSSGASITASSNFGTSSDSTTSTAVEAPSSTAAPSPTTEVTETPTASDTPETFVQLAASSSNSDYTTSTQYSTTTSTSTIIVAGSTTSIYLTSSSITPTSTLAILPVVNSTTSSTIPTITSYATPTFSSTSSWVYSKNTTITTSPTPLSTAAATAVPSIQTANLGARMQISMVSFIVAGLTAWIFA